MHLRSGDPARQPGTFDPGWQRLRSPGHSVLALRLEGPHLRGWLQPEAAKVAVTHCFAKVPHGFLYTWSWVKIHNGTWFSIFDLLICVCVCVFSWGGTMIKFSRAWGRNIVLSSIPIDAQVDLGRCVQPKPGGCRIAGWIAGVDVRPTVWSASARCDVAGWSSNPHPGWKVQSEPGARDTTKRTSTANAWVWIQDGLDRGDFADHFADLCVGRATAELLLNGCHFLRLKRNSNTLRPWGSSKVRRMENINHFHLPSSTYIWALKNPNPRTSTKLSKTMRGMWRGEVLPDSAHRHRPAVENQSWFWFGLVWTVSI